MSRSVVATLLAVGAAAALVVVAWPEAPRQADPSGAMPRSLHGKAQGHVYTSAVAEPANVNPLTARGATVQSLILGVTHDTLLDRDSRTGELRPALAERFVLADDALHCTFWLRDDVVFSDGSPLSMADVHFAWQIAAAGHLPMGAAAGAFARVRDVEIVSERELRVHFRERYFGNVAAVGEGWIVVQRAFFDGLVAERLGPDEAMPAVDSKRYAELVGQVRDRCGPGTGPYALVNDPSGVRNWTPGQQMLLVRSESSWRRKVREGTWNFAAMKLLFRDATSATTALLRGELDWYSGANAAELLAANSSVADAYRLATYDFPQLGVYRIVWNCARPPFDRPEVRRALSVLMPRDESLAVLSGAGQQAYAHAKPAAGCYPEVEHATADPAKARALLRAAGFDPAQGTPLRLTLLALQGSEALRRISELVGDALRQAGVEVDLRSRELSSFLADQQRGEWHGSLVLQWFDSSGDPYRFLHGDGRSNPGMWRNEQADELAVAARREHDPAARDAIWKRLHALAHREQPAALLVHPYARVLLRRSLQDFEPGAFGLRPEWAWVEPEQQRPQ